MGITASSKNTSTDVEELKEENRNEENKTVEQPVRKDNDEIQEFCSTLGMRRN